MGPLFVTTALVEGARRPDYDPLRHPISSLALGTSGWVQAANFAAAGTLALAAGTGLWRAHDRLGAIAVGTTGACLLGSAAFRTDPVSGYPPGTPGAPATPTTRGIAHNASAVPIFLGVPLAQLAHGLRRVRTDPAWAAYSGGSAVAMFIGFAGASAGFSQAERYVRWGGLFQRLAVVSGLGWIAALSMRAQRGKA
jgi:hypothetical protein